MTAFEKTWAVVELMGHSVVAGEVSEQTLAGAPMVRIDVPNTEFQEAYTKYYSTGAIYCITPCDQATAIAASIGLRQKPVDLWKLNLPPQLMVMSDVGRAPDYEGENYDPENEDEDDTIYFENGEYSADEEPF